jgi:chorismate mutase
MTKKVYNNDLFVYLDWILKKKGSLSIESLPYPFIVNRWLSMADPSIAQIVNATSNRWINVKNSISSDQLQIAKFFKTVLPVFKKRISYIKKVSKEKETEDFTIVAKNMECSIREVEILEKTLAEININVNKNI